MRTLEENPEEKTEKAPERAGEPPPTAPPEATAAAEGETQRDRRRSRRRRRGQRREEGVAAAPAVPEEAGNVPPVLEPAPEKKELVDEFLDFVGSSAATPAKELPPPPPPEEAMQVKPPEGPPLPPAPTEPERRPATRRRAWNGAQAYRELAEVGKAAPAVPVQAAPAERSRLLSMTDRAGNMLYLCPDCGSFVDGRATICAKCGASLEEIEAPAVPPVVPVPPLVPEPEGPAPVHVAVEAEPPPAEAEAPAVEEAVAALEELEAEALVEEVHPEEVVEEAVEEEAPGEAEEAAAEAPEVEAEAGITTEVVPATLGRDRFLFFSGVVLTLAGGIGLAMGSFLHDLLRLRIGGTAWTVFGPVNLFWMGIGVVILTVGVGVLVASLRGGVVEIPRGAKERASVE